VAARERIGWSQEVWIHARDRTSRAGAALRARSA
jgi:hypothetical protein